MAGRFIGNYGVFHHGLLQARKKKRRKKKNGPAAAVYSRSHLPGEVDYRPRLFVLLPPLPCAECVLDESRAAEGTSPNSTW